MKSTITLLVVLILIVTKSNAQIASSESFDLIPFEPNGWTNLLVSGTNVWSRVTSGTNPAQTTHSGAGEAMFDSYNA